MSGRRSLRVPLPSPIARVDAREIHITLHDAANNLDLTAVLTLSKDKPDMEVTVSGTGPLKNFVGFPFPFVSGKGTGLVVPMNEGILYPVDDDEHRPNRRLSAYSGHGICMPWFGATNVCSRVRATWQSSRRRTTRRSILRGKAAPNCTSARYGKRRGDSFLRSQDPLCVLRSRRICRAGQALSRVRERDGALQDSGGQSDARTRMSIY